MEIIIPVIGGLALFLYGMNVMSEGLQKVAGRRLQSYIEIFTKNRFIGVIVGCVVTMIIQSSSATTVMVVGFVNAGIMTLPQSVGIIIGANLGTTITGQIIALNITEFAPVAIAIGVVFWLFSKKKKVKDLSEILIGFGILFMGMGMMSGGLKPLSNIYWFKNGVLILNNPYLGMPIEIVLTTIVQSSSASIGLLEALGKTGLINMNQAFPLLFGSNIGTTTTALISSMGAGKNAKRAAFIHFLFNFIGTVIFMLFLRIPVQRFVVWATPGDVAKQIANSHTLFNFINIIIQFPFSNLLVKASYFFVKGEDENTGVVSKYLDERILETPTIAVSQAHKEVVRMGHMVFDNLENIIKYFNIRNENTANEIRKIESNIDKLEKEIIEYIVKLSSKNISDSEKKHMFILIDSVNDFERIGDHIENICELLEQLADEGTEFSETAIIEFEKISTLAKKAVKYSLETLENNDLEKAEEVIEIEKEIDRIEKKYRRNHIIRINSGLCRPSAGVAFIDILGNIERISDHAENISNYKLKG